VVKTDCKNDNRRQHELYAWDMFSNYVHAPRHTAVLRLCSILSGTTRVSRQQKGKTRKVKPIWIYWSER